MENVQTEVKITPFWGNYILSTIMLESEKNNSELKKKERESLKIVYEMIDDYVEQA